MDPRHLQRIKTIENLFALTFAQAKKNLPHPKDEQTIKVIKNLKKIDGYINKNAPKFPIARIAKADLAILRLAVYELMIKPTQPYKVVINEAVELSKEFGGDKSYMFVNGVLGKVVNKKND